MPKLYRQISYGIDEIIQKCGADIHSTEDWETIFLLLKTAGAGLILEKTVENREIVGDGDNISCATSETDLSQRNRSQKNSLQGSSTQDLDFYCRTIQSGISDTESESGNASDRGYTSDRDDQPTEILSLVSFQRLFHFGLSLSSQR